MSRLSLFRDFLLASACAIILIGADQVGAAQFGATPAGAAQAGATQAGTGQAGTAQAGAAPAGAAPAAAANLRPPLPPMFTWTGIYVGGQVGYIWGDNSGAIGYATPGGLTGDDALGSGAQGVIGGAHVGYNYQINQWVIGVEGAVDPTTLNRNVLVLPPDGSTVTGTLQSNIQGSIRGRAGFTIDRLLIYGTGGIAFAGFNSNIQFYGTDLIGAFYANDSLSSTRVGWTAGGGIEYAINTNWSVRGEYRYSDFGHITELPAFPAAGLTYAANRHLAQNQVQVGFSYKFAPSPSPVVAKY